MVTIRSRKNHALVYIDKPLYCDLILATVQKKYKPSLVVSFNTGNSLPSNSIKQCAFSE